MYEADEEHGGPGPSRSSVDMTPSDILPIGRQSVSSCRLISFPSVFGLIEKGVGGQPLWPLFIRQVSEKCSKPYTAARYVTIDGGYWLIASGWFLVDSGQDDRLFLYVTRWFPPVASRTVPTWFR